MLTLRSRIGVAAVDGLLYAFGGYDGTSRLQTVECYEPKVVFVYALLNCMYINQWGQFLMFQHRWLYYFSNTLQDIVNMQIPLAL